jgi:peptidoglycan hydrolase CwlO-like protein
VTPFLIIIPVLFLSQATAPITSETLAQTTSASSAERQQLESQLQDLEKQIGDYEKTVSQYQSQGASLKGEINTLNAKINKINLQIKAVTLSIRQLDGEITTTNGKIGNTQQKIGSTKDSIGGIVKALYENDKDGLVEVLLKNPQLSDFFNNVNNLVEVQNNLRLSLTELKSLKDDLTASKESLILQKEDKAALKTYQDSQKQVVQEVKTQKSTLLKDTQGKESVYQKLLTDTKAKAAEIRNRIFRLQGGGELPFGDAVKIAQVAERATGVRAAFILAILTQESSIDGVIGKNLGKCYYNTPASNAAGTVMSNSQKLNFLSIMKSLGMDPATTPVSCPIISDGAYGGAIGPAQFMPNTWMLYTNKVTAITGGNPASPFNNLDAFTGTALLLKDGLVGCQATYSNIFSQENCAAAKYYAGGNWKIYTKIGRYGYRVADRADGFAGDIQVLAQNQ